MSNSLGIAAVTTAFGQFIAEAMQVASNLSAAAELRWGPPAADLGFVGANLFLYRVAPNASRRNDDLTTRDAGGRLQQRPTAALDLDYLLSFHGDERALEPQRLMGGVIAALHAEPVFSAARVRAAIAAAGTRGPLAGGEFDAAAPVRFTLQPLDLEALHRIWSLFDQVPFALSIAYTGSALLLEADRSPMRALPARTAMIAVTPHRAPLITRVAPVALPFGAGASITILGEDFAGGAPSALIGGQPAPVAWRDGALVASLPDRVLAGEVPVQVAFGGAGPSAPRFFWLQPRVADGAVARATSDGASGRPLTIVTCRLAPLPGWGQSATMFLNPAPPGRPGMVAMSSKLTPRASIALSAAADLDRATATAALRAALAAVGVSVAANARVIVLAPGAAWRVEDADGACRLESDGERILVYFRLAAGYADGNAAFVFPALAPGPYLVSVQIGDSPPCVSPLRSGDKLFDVTDGASVLDRGEASEALIAQFAAAGVVFATTPSLRRPIPGDGWEVVGGPEDRRFWIAAGDLERPLYALDTLGGPYFGPLATAP